MKTLILEGVRAFRDRAEIPLGKLTLLVGENSTGKSTVLASTRIAWDVVHRPEAPIEFNEDPFELGTYDSIAHYHGGQGRRVKQFTIGGMVEVLVKGGVVSKRKDARSAAPRAGAPARPLVAPDRRRGPRARGHDRRLRGPLTASLTPVPQARTAALPDRKSVV